MAMIRVTLVYDIDVEDGNVEVVVDTDPVFVAGGVPVPVEKAWLHFDDAETLETREEAHAAWVKLNEEAKGKGG